MNTADTTRIAIDQLLDQVAHHGHAATAALDAGDHARAHDELSSARSLLDIACILTDPDTATTCFAIGETSPTGERHTGPRGRDRERLNAYTGPDGIGQLDLDAKICVPLGNAGFDTITDLQLAVSAGTIKDVPGIGPKRIQEIADALAAYDAPRLRAVPPAAS
jgi:hypothetical protein